ncbi:MAG TPA: hypothetical protein VG125_13955 [Pirellulales bacterium]|jgi:hypothetical protein|nr:hypothetical protein [Pirellulales bacterium]
MAMFLAYGSHAHQAGECDVSIDRVVFKSTGQVPLSVLETWTIKGLLTSQIGPTDIDAQIAALKAAYAIDGQDLVLYMPDGVTPTSTVLRSSSCLGGTRVEMAPSFPGGRPAERVGFVGYTIKVVGEIPVTTGNVLTDYHESIKARGGTPVIGYLEPAVGIPVPQLFKQTSTFKVVQDGHATGYNFAPQIGVDVGIPIWPAFILPQQTELNAESPDRQITAYKNYKVSWHFEFESVTPLLGNPTPWPLTM